MQHGDLEPDRDGQATSGHLQDVPQGDVDGIRLRGEPVPVITLATAASSRSILVRITHLWCPSVWSGIRAGPPQGSGSVELSTIGGRRESSGTEHGHDCGVGIRYYAYAFDAARTRQAIENPRSILSRDPLADAWGMEPHASSGIATMEQVSPKSDMLYLDKAWRDLQSMTRPTDPTAPPRPAFRMFEGQVRTCTEGWDAWVRTILPDEVAAIRDDLWRLGAPDVDAQCAANPHSRELEDERHYVYAYLRRAQEFMVGLAERGRGMVYVIG